MQGRGQWGPPAQDPEQWRWAQGNSKKHFSWRGADCSVQAVTLSRAPAQGPVSEGKGPQTQPEGSFPQSHSRRDREPQGHSALSTSS